MCFVVISVCVCVSVCDSYLIQLTESPACAATTIRVSDQSGTTLYFRRSPHISSVRRGDSPTGRRLAPRMAAIGSLQ